MYALTVAVDTALFESKGTEGSVVEVPPVEAVESFSILIVKYPTAVNVIPETVILFTVTVFDAEPIILNIGTFTVVAVTRGTIVEALYVAFSAFAVPSVL